MKTAKKACAVLAACLLALLCACAGPTVVTVAVPAEEAPFSFLENGERAGFEIDLANEAARRAGLTVRFAAVADAQLEGALADRRADAVIALPRARAGKDVLLSHDYLRDSLVYLTLSEGGVSSAQDVEGRPVGMVTGSPAEKALSASGKGKALRDGAPAQFVDLDTELLAMEAGQIDAAALFRGEALYRQQNNARRYKVVAAAADDEAFSGDGQSQGLGRSFAVAVRRNDARLRNAFQQSLDAMEKDGALTALSQKWFGDDLTVKSAESGR